jgi:hypothetical protein
MKGRQNERERKRAKENNDMTKEIRGKEKRRREN